MIDLSFITATIIKQPIIYHQNWMLAGYIFLSGTVVIHSEFLDKYSEVLSTFLETHQFHLNYGNSRLIFLYLLSVYIK